MHIIVLSQQGHWPDRGHVRVGQEMPLVTERRAQRPSQATTMQKWWPHSSVKASSRNFFLRLKLQQKCRDTQASFTPGQLRPQGLAWRHRDVIERDSGQRAGISSTTCSSVLSTDLGSSLCHPTGQIPPASQGGVQRAPAGPHAQGFVRKHGRLSWSFPACAKTLPARIWLLFQSNSLEHGEADRVPEEVWGRAPTHVPAKTFTPSAAPSRCELAAAETCTQSQGQRDSGMLPRKPDPAKGRAPLCTVHHLPN